MNAPTELNLESLAADFAAAKEDEAAAVSRRRAIGEQIAALLKDRDEGSRTERAGNLKVTVTYKMDRKVDSTKLQGMWPNLSAHAQEAFKWSADVAIAKLRALQEFRPDEYAFVAGCITAKEGAAQVKVEEVK